MTSSRVIRGTKAKIFLYICAVFVITGLIVCFNNTLSQLDDVKKSNEICHQQEENLSTQLQVISEYKQRLEKSLKTEKAEHHQTKTKLETKFSEEKMKNQQTNNEAKIKFNTLQQHFNLLQTQHDDAKEECSKTQEKQLQEINDLQSKLKEVQEQLKKVEASKESLKSQNLELQMSKENLEQEMKDAKRLKTENENKINHLTFENEEIKRNIKTLKEKCPNVELEVHHLTSPRSSPNPNGADAKSPQNVLGLPDNMKSSSTSTASSPAKVSQGKLSGARPLHVPIVTPESSNKNVVFPLPKGVVPMPDDNRGSNEQPNDIINNRYQSKIDKPQQVKDENGAHEEFDIPGVNGNGGGAYDALVFGGDKNDGSGPKQVGEKPNVDKQHIDTMGAVKNYEDGMPNEIPAEEPDDDDPDYADNLRRNNDPAVRN